MKYFGCNVRTYVQLLSELEEGKYPKIKEAPLGQKTVSKIDLFLMEHRPI